jgi:DNA-binding protein H-NS
MPSASGKKQTAMAVAPEFEDMLSFVAHEIQQRNSIRIMAKTYADIQKEIESLQKTAETLRQKEVAGVIERIKTAIATYQLTARDLGLVARAAAPTPMRAKAGKGAKPARRAAFRDEAGNSWSGRGRRPGWVNAALAAGKSLDDFRV